MSKGVVYIGAHQDDILSVVGTLILLKKKGYNVHEFCITRGQKGGPEPDIAQIRTEEEYEVCKLIGAELRFFEQMDGELFAGEQICKDVAMALEEIKPDVVITHWALEKPDHSAVFGIALKAMHLSGIYWTSEFYFCQSDSHGYNFRPELYVNISDVMDDVAKVCACYKSQQVQPFTKHLLNHKREIGKNAWCDAAEGFMTNVPLINKRWDRKAEVGRILLDL